MRSLPQKIVEGLTTKSDKIRALARAGYARTEIAAFLKIRYQHVRGVLVQSGFDGGLANDPAPSRALNENAYKRKEAPSLTTDRLMAAGFTKLGQWLAKSETSFELSGIAPAHPGVYAFAVNGVVRYIGLTQTGLRTRLGHYVYGYSGQATNARIKQLIASALSGGAVVEVFIAIPHDLTWNGLPINSAVGLEAGLIRTFRPEWNLQGVKATAL